MSALWGWCGALAASEDFRTVALRMIARPGLPGAWDPQIATLGGGAICLASTDPENQLYTNDGVIVGVGGRIDWKTEALADIALRKGSASALFSGYDAHGPEVLERISGPYSLAIIVDGGNEIFLASDRAGSRTLSYSVSDRFLVFGPDPGTISRHPAVKASIDPQSYFDYIYFHVIPTPGSIYKGIRCLPPASYVLKQADQLSEARYWRPRYDRSYAGRKFDDLKQELRDLVCHSVENAISSARSPGAFLSGGIDSSTVTGVLAELIQGAPRAYSIGFDVDDYDELSYARVTAQHFGAEHREYKVTPNDIVDAVPKIAERYAQPFGNSSVIPSYFCGKLAAADGIDLLLGGDGGDELFGGNERYAVQKIFEAYRMIPEQIRTRLIERLLLSRSQDSRIWPIGKIRRYVEKAVMPVPARLQAYNFVTHFGSERIFNRDFLAEVDQSRPLATLTQYYDDVDAESTVDKMLGLDLKFTLSDNDLPKVSGACELAGVDVAYPLLSDELIEFAARLPDGLKVRGLKLRYFFKNAYKDFLPAETIAKSKHGFGLPFGVWTASDHNLRAFVEDTLIDTKKLGVVREDFINNLMTEYVPTHPQYYGEIVWLLVMLGQWYEIHAKR